MVPPQGQSARPSSPFLALPGETQRQEQALAFQDFSEHRTWAVCWQYEAWPLHPSARRVA